MQLVFRHARGRKSVAVLAKLREGVLAGHPFFQLFQVCLEPRDRFLQRRQARLLLCQVLQSRTAGQLRHLREFLLKAGLVDPLLRRDSPYLTLHRRESGLRLHRQLRQLLLQCSVLTRHLRDLLPKRTSRVTHQTSGVTRSRVHVLGTDWQTLQRTCKPQPEFINRGLQHAVKLHAIRHFPRYVFANLQTHTVDVGPNTVLESLHFFAQRLGPVLVHDNGGDVLCRLPVNWSFTGTASLAHSSAQTRNPASASAPACSRAADYTLQRN
mmetsp:Transcript_60773/g.161455  ORF Transcript_60773/g.161455 Transcript_60773/m.161455 type:complete len:268 (+) Transcript_60773:735-1538(+)